MFHNITAFAVFWIKKKCRLGEQKIKKSLKILLSKNFWLVVYFF